MAAEQTTGGYKDIREYLEALESKGLLKRVTAEVDLKHELGAIAARSLERNGPALLFENVKGYPGMPFAANLLTTDERVGIALGTVSDHEKIYEKIVLGMEHRLPSVEVPSGPCKDEVYRGDQVDVYKFPTPWWHELD